MALPLGAIFMAELDAQCRNLVARHSRERITPGSEYVGQRRSEVFVTQMSHARHDGVVFLAVYRDRARQAEQRDGEHVLAIASQVIGFGKRRERPCQSAPVGLVTGGAIAFVNLLAIRHHFFQGSGRGLGRVDCRGVVFLAVRFCAGRRQKGATEYGEQMPDAD